MEVAKKQPAAGAPAAKEPAPTLASGKYTFSKAEALRRYLQRKQRKPGKGVSAAKREEVMVYQRIFFTDNISFLIICQNVE